MSSRVDGPVAQRKPSFALVGAFGFAGAAVWVLPVLCGVIGMAFALVALARHERLARLSMLVVVGAVIVGLLLHQLPASFYT